jgi:hypothetical protein
MNYLATNKTGAQAVADVADIRVQAGKLGVYTALEDAGVMDVVSIKFRPAVALPWVELASISTEGFVVLDVPAGFLNCTIDALAAGLHVGIQQ